MIRAIKEEYCKENLVQLIPYSDVCQLIIDKDEILLLKDGNNILINKYANHPKRFLFPYSDKEINYDYDNKRYTQLFEYNKIYLNFRSSVSGASLHKNYFFKGTKRALYLNETLSLDDRNLLKDERYLTREETEKFFDSEQYDSMYILDKNGNIIYAKSNNDGVVIDKKIIPSDEEIIKSELENRTSIEKKLLGNNHDTTFITKQYSAKTIDEIENFSIYGPILFSDYSHILITVKDGNFDVKWFTLDFIQKDKFKLTTSNILVTEPTIDDVINYTENDTIRYIPDPIKLENNEAIKKAIEKIPEDNLPEITLTHDNIDENKLKDKENTPKFLRKLLKKD